MTGCFDNSVGDAEGAQDSDSSSDSTGDSTNTPSSIVHKREHGILLEEFLRLPGVTGNTQAITRLMATYTWGQVTLIMAAMTITDTDKFLTVVHDVLIGALSIIHQPEIILEKDAMSGVTQILRQIGTYQTVF